MEKETGDRRYHDVHGGQRDSQPCVSMRIDVTNLAYWFRRMSLSRLRVEVGADAICVSSPMARVRLTVPACAKKCDEAGPKGIPLYAGGNLVVGKVPVEEIERRYKAMGFDRAFGPGTDPQVTIGVPEKDLGIECFPLFSTQQ